jgi:hypothetical protein
MLAGSRAAAPSKRRIYPNGDTIAARRELSGDP